VDTLGRAVTEGLSTTERVWAYLSSHPHASRREIRDALKLSSTSVVNHHIDKLADLGHIERGAKHTSRTTKVSVIFGRLTVHPPAALDT